MKCDTEDTVKKESKLLKNKALKYNVNARN